MSQSPPLPISKNDLDKLAIIYAFLAAKIFQLKFADEQIKDMNCEKNIVAKIQKYRNTEIQIKKLAEYP